MPSRSLWYSACQPLRKAGPSDVPRNETLIVENPEGTIKNAGWFNIWAVNAGGQSTGLHQLTMDTFWFIDPDHGLDGVWDNSLAVRAADLQCRLHRDDGQAAARDLLERRRRVHGRRRGLHHQHPPQDQRARPERAVPAQRRQHLRSRQVHGRLQAEEAELAVPCAVHGALERACGSCRSTSSRGKDPLKFDFNPPVSLGPYKLHGYDPNGQWFTWQKRDDWQRTSLARFGEPGPRYVTYVDPGPPDKRVIAQLNHELDIIHDTSPEGVFTLVKESPTSKGWFDGFPYGHPDPTLPQVIFNHQNPKFQNRDVRWALALALDIKAIVDGVLSRCGDDLGDRGAADGHASRTIYHKPMQEWLTDFELDTGKKVIKPYDPTIGQQIADMLRPSMGDQIPTDPEQIDAAFGLGWWKQDREAAAQLLERAGFTRRGNDWYMPDGQRFSIKVVVEGEARPVMTRGGSMIAEQWRRFGVDATTESAQAAFLTRRNGGDFEAIISWSVETWGGHPDLSFFLDSWHSQFVQPAGDRADAPQLVALVEPGARQDHRADPRHRLRRPEGRSSSARSSSSSPSGRCRSSR